MSGKPGRPPTRPPDPMLLRVFAVLRSYGVDTPKKLVLCLRAHEPDASRHVTTLRRSIEEGKGVPIDWLIQVCQLTKCRMAWLKTGLGDVYDDDPTVSTYGQGAKDCLSLWTHLAPPDRKIWTRVGRLLPKHRDYVAYQCDLLEQGSRPEEDDSEVTNE